MYKKKVIMDVDTGTDDAVAIMTAALSGKLDILGITVTHGNHPLANTVDNTLRVVDFLEMDIPVYAGCPDPMVRGLMPGRALNVRRQTLERIIDGESITIHQKVLDLPQAHSTQQAMHACSFLVQTLKAATEKITIIAVGPLTNIGMALRMDPSIKENIEEIVIMGGAINAGNRTPAAEANFYDDPEAAQIVLKSGCKLRIFTLEATESCLCTNTEIEAFRGCSDAGRFAGDLIEGFIRRLKLLGTIQDEAVAVHDATTVCGVIDDSCVTVMRQHACDVEISGGWADGQLVVDKRIFAAPADPVYVVYEVDAKRCIRIMLDAFSEG